MTYKEMVELAILESKVSLDELGEELIKLPGNLEDDKLGLAIKLIAEKLEDRLDCIRSIEDLLPKKTKEDTP